MAHRATIEEKYQWEPLEEVSLRGFGRLQKRNVFDWPFLARVRQLATDVDPDGDSLRYLLTSPFLSQLKLLRLRATHSPSVVNVEKHIGEHVAQCSGLTNLESLECWNCELDEKQMRHLLHSPYLRNITNFCWHEKIESRFNSSLSVLAQECNWDKLHHLSLHLSHFSTDGLTKLRRANWISQLTAITLSHSVRNSLTLFSSRMKNLSEVNLEGNSIGQGGAQMFASALQDIQLSSLNLRLNRLGSEGIQALSQYSTFDSVERLNLASNRLGNDGCALLAQHEFPNLRKLTLRQNGIEEQGMEHLFQRAIFPQLRELDLTDNPFRQKGLSALCRNPCSNSLRRLALQRTQLDSMNSLHDLIQPGRFRNLRSLALMGTSLPSNTVTAFCESELAHQLIHLTIQCSQITNTVLQSLLKLANSEWLIAMDLVGYGIGRESIEANQLREAFGDRLRLYM